MSLEKSIDTPTFFPDRRKRKKKNNFVSPQPFPATFFSLSFLLKTTNSRRCVVVVDRLVKVDTQQRKWVGVVLAAVWGRERLEAILLSSFCGFPPHACNSPTISAEATSHHPSLAFVSNVTWVSEWETSYLFRNNLVFLLLHQLHVCTSGGAPLAVDTRSRSLILFLLFGQFSVLFSFLAHTSFVFVLRWQTRTL